MAPETAAPQSTPEEVIAVAQLEPNKTVTGNQTWGTVYFSPTPTGLEVNGRLMQVANGQHGLHIHVRGNCVDPGEHFAPNDNPHGPPGEGEHHLGDLGNVQPDPASEAWISMNIEGLTLQGEQSVIGKALVVAQDPDDLKTQPTGNSGGVLACGIIEADEEAEVRPEAQARL
jgi:Cu-Zn family superoxide dismutase